MLITAILTPDLYAREAFRSERLLLMTPAGMTVEGTIPYRLTADDIHRTRTLPDTVAAVPLSLFQEEPFLMLKEGNDTRTRADQLCEAAGFRPKARLLLDQQITSYNLACYGMGAAFVSDTLVRHVPPTSTVWFYRLAGERAQRDICFYYRRSRHLTSAVLEFMRMVREMSEPEPA